MKQQTLVAQQFGSTANAYLTSAVHSTGKDLQVLRGIAERCGSPDILDLGCGAGHVSFAVSPVARSVKAYDLSQQMLDVVARAAQERGLRNIETHQGAAEALPFADAEFDIVMSRFSAHHWMDVPAALREIARVLKPGGWGYISWTNWYSPWGGHDMTPYQYLGPKLGPRLYVRRHGPPRKNAYGEGLWAQHIGSTLKLVRARPDLEITRVEPRYWPRLRFIVAIPLVREVLTWNCVIRVRKRPG